MGERRERNEAHAETRRKAKENGLSSPLNDWKTLHFGDICSRVQETVTPSQSGSRVYLGLEHLASGSPSLVGRGTEADVKSGKTAFRQNDVLFGKLRPYLRKSVRVDESGVCSTDILVFRPNKGTDADYLCYLTHTREFIDHAMATTSGVNHPRTSWSSLKEFKTLVPPLATQREIAAILGQVQKAIEAQERLLALTVELKRTLLHRLFTQGLHGEPQKQTDIGPVPESWEVVPLHDCATVQTGVAKGRQLAGKDILELPYLRVANVQAGYLNLSEIKTITLLAKERARFELQKGDIVLTEGGDFDKLGRGFIWQGEIEHCVHQNHIFAVRVDRKILLPEFFAYQSQSPYGKAYFLSVAHKTTNLACINTTKLKAFPVLLPPMDEQKSMVETLHAVDARLRQHQRKHATLSDLFRTLLHQLMTGQISLNEANTTNLRAFASSRDNTNAVSREAAKNAKGYRV